MGRHAGWLAVQSGLAGGADVVLIPEFPITVERCADVAPVTPAAATSRSWSSRRAGRSTHEAGPRSRDADGELDAFGHVRLGGVGDRLAEELKRLTGFERA